MESKLALLGGPKAVQCEAGMLLTNDRPGYERTLAFGHYLKRLGGKE